jgi:outer membrane protein assembly factor BamA
MNRLIVAILLLTGLCVAQSATRLVIQEVSFTGATTLDSDMLHQITSSLTATESADDTDELTERIRDAFQQRGYFKTGINHVKIHPLDPLARPEPVRIEAEVAEGPRFKISSLQFSGYNAFSAEELRATFPVRPGDFADTGKIRSGLGALRGKYASSGYVDIIPVPTTLPAGADSMTLRIELHEGPQYRMASPPLDLIGKSDHADELQLAWKLRPGNPFDETYLAKFLDENRSLLPDRISVGNDAFFTRGCRDNSVTVHLVLSSTARMRPQDRPCEKEQSAPEKAK